MDLGTSRAVGVWKGFSNQIVPFVKGLSDGKRHVNTFTAVGFLPLLRPRFVQFEQPRIAVVARVAVRITCDSKPVVGGADDGCGFFNITRFAIPFVKSQIACFIDLNHPNIIAIDRTTFLGIADQNHAAVLRQSCAFYVFKAIAKIVIFIENNFPIAYFDAFQLNLLVISPCTQQISRAVVAD